MPRPLPPYQEWPCAAADLWIAGVAFHTEGRGVEPPAASDGRFPGFDAPDPDAPPDLECDAHVELSPLSDTPDPGHERVVWHFKARGDRWDLAYWSGNPNPIWRMVTEDAMRHVHCVFNPRFSEVFCRNLHLVFPRQMGRTALTFRLLRHGGLGFHGSGSDFEGAGILCVGPSGFGKSTISRLLAEAGARVLSDERPFVRRRPDGSFRLHGTPWWSSGHFACNRSVPLRKIYFIEHGDHDEILPLRGAPLLRRLRDVAMIPWDAPEFFDPALATAEALLQAVPCAILRFRPTPAVADRIRRDLETDA